MEFILFLSFSALMLASATAVIMVPNPVHSVLALVLSFVSSCGLMMLLQVEFMALVFIMVYVGAIAVLFLFVVMMLNLGRLKDTMFSTGWMGMFLMRGLVEWILVDYVYASISVPLSVSSSESYVMWSELLDTFTTLDTLGQVLYTHYLSYLLMAGFVLLVARIGAIVLTLKVRTFALSKRQQVFQQLSRDADRAILLVRAPRAMSS